MQPTSRSTSPIFLTDEDISNRDKKYYKTCKRLFLNNGSLHLKEALEISKCLEDAYSIVGRVFDKMRDRFEIHLDYFQTTKSYLIFSIKIIEPSKR